MKFMIRFSAFSFVFNESMIIKDINTLHHFIN